MDRAWTFETARFVVRLEIEQESFYQYDGDDENGETQTKLDSGDYIAFTSKVSVWLDGREIAADYLGGSVYNSSNIDDFWTAHRDKDPMNRNSSIMRNTNGENYVICHYFPGMVYEAIKEARRYLAKSAPKLRVYG